MALSEIDRAIAAGVASALGKTANCQTLVSLTLARGEVPVMLALRLFLPESWTSKRARLERAGMRLGSSANGDRAFYPLSMNQCNSRGRSASAEDHNEKCTLNLLSSRSPVQP